MIRASLANNLIIDNDGVDLDLDFFNLPFLLLNNAYDELDDPLDPDSEGNIVFPDPMFQPGLLNFRPSRNSPLTDSGTTDIFGMIGEFDLDRKDRIIGPQIDIGAYENDLLFAGEFESATPL